MYKKDTEGKKKAKKNEEKEEEVEDEDTEKVISLVFFIVVRIWRFYNSFFSELKPLYFSK